MKRDMDLVRQILLEIEAAPSQKNTGFSDKITDQFTHKEITHHIELLDDAGLICAEATHYFDSTVDWKIDRLTWRGHEFLDAARDQNRWDQAKRTISEKGGSLTFDVLKAVLSQLARQAVGL